MMKKKTAPLVSKQLSIKIISSTIYGESMWGQAEPPPATVAPLISNRLYIINTFGIKAVRKASSGSDVSSGKSPPFTNEYSASLMFSNRT